MRIALPVIPSPEPGQEQMAGGWGRAEDLALVDVTNGEVTGWQVVHTGWNALHDEGTHGAHHARIVRFCREHEITDVIVTHMGQGMVNTLTKLGLRLHQTTVAGARESVDALLAEG